MAAPNGYIDRILIKDFKSYGSVDGEPQTIGPFKTFTSIIGPNGAGKSNLMDAISFVFGVRSSQLRTNDMRKLVYRRESESETSRAVKERTAFVELIFVKGNGSQLRFRRAILVSGSSEYSVNNRVLPAAEYNRELESIGVLVSARNFLVFQGDVESVARKTPKELCALVEEISGSARLRDDYEAKKEAQASAEEEMIRIFERRRVIIKERKQLRDQKEEADRYQELIDELKGQRLEFNLWQLFHVDKDRSLEIAGLADDKRELAEKAQEVKQVEAAEDDLLRQKAALHKERVALEKKLAAKQKELDKKQSVIAKLQEQITHSQDQVKQSESRRKTLEKDHKAQQEQRKQLEQELAEVTEQLDEVEAEENEEGGELKLAAAQMAEYQKLKSQAEVATSALNREADSLRREHDTLKERKSHLETSLQSLRERLKVSETSVGQITARRDAMQRSLRDSEVAQVETRKKFDQLNESIQTSGEKKRQLEDRLTELDALINASKADKRDNEREQKLANAIEQMKRLYPGVLGRVIDLCRPTQHRYSSAVQVGLGKNIDAVVVDTDQTARNCIEYLKEQRVGVATFIPAESVRVEPVREALRELGGTAKLLLDVIDCGEDASVQRAIQFAVANTLVCDTMDEAKRLAYGERNRRLKIVVLDGTLLSRNGTITGGGQVNDDAYGGGRSSSWDERDYQRNKAERDKVFAERAEIEKLGRQSDQLQSFRLQLNTFDNRMKNTRAELQALSDKLEKENQDQKEIATEIQSKAEALETVDSDFETTGSKLEEIESRVRHQQDAIFADFSRKVGVKHVQEYEKSRLTSIRERTERKLQLADTKSKLENQIQYEQSRDLGKQIASLDRKLEELRDKVQSQQAELEKTRKHDGKAECDELTALMKEKQGQEEAQDREIKKLKKANEQVFKDIATIEQKVISREAVIDKLNTVRREYIRRCEMESIVLPISSKSKSKSKSSSSAAAAAAKKKRKPAAKSSSRRRKAGEEEDLNEDEEEEEEEEPEDAMAVDGDDTEEITFDYSSLTQHREIASRSQYDEVKKQYLGDIDRLQKQLEEMNPNLKANERFQEAETKLQDQQSAFDKAKEASKVASESLEAIKMERRELFMSAFDKVAKEIASIYRVLTSDGSRESSGGVAEFILDNEDEPYLGGITYSVIPPGKRFRGMDQMSGGEKTVASLVLLFALHSYKPAPFFVLDEVDAALDAKNVFRIANYIRNRARRDRLQCVVISLKDSFYEKADALVGVFKDKAKQCSGTLTLDLQQYDN